MSTIQDAKILAPDDVKRLLGRVKRMDGRDYDFFTIAVGTGLRLSEVAHLEAQDVLANRCVVVRRKKKHLVPTEIDVMHHVMEILRRRAASVGVGFLFPGGCQPCIIERESKEHGPSTEQVCIGGHCSLRLIQKRWRLALEDVGLWVFGRGIHTLRHVAITEMYRATKDLLAAKAFAGHSSVSTTEGYAHIVALQEALAKIPVLA